MSPLTSYRRLLALAGPLYVVVAFLGRLPLAMSQLGTLLLVSGATGSYGAGGASAGALAVANAVGAPWPERSPTVSASATSCSCSRWPAPRGWSRSCPCPPPVCRGRSRPPPPRPPGWSCRRSARSPASAGGRSRGTPAPDQRRLVDAAFSYEGAADEASFVARSCPGRCLRGLVAPAAALLVAAVVLAVFGTLFAMHESAELTRRLHGAAAARPPGRLLTPALVILATAQLAIGVVFGSVQTATSVLATAAGVPGMTGLLHALLGVGSVVAGLAVTALPASFGYERRMRLFAVALFVLALPLLLRRTPWASSPSRSWCSAWPWRRT